MTYYDDLKMSRSAAVFLRDELKEFVNDQTIPIVVEEPELYMARATGLFSYTQNLQSTDTLSIDPSAIIFQEVSLGTGVKVGRN